MALIASFALRAGAAGPPLTPDGDDARRWAEDELSHSAYEAAQPTAFDRMAQAIAEFIDALFSNELPDGLGSTLIVIAAVVVAALLLAAILIWGLPRATSRSRVVTAELFGESESRSATQLRREAASCVAREDWDGAIVLRFRALARGLTERGVVETPPGATVHAFARAAGRPFPAHSGELEAAAAAFDDVRYLRRPGTAELYRRIAAVDDAVAAARPVAQVLV